MRTQLHTLALSQITAVSALRTPFGSMIDTTTLETTMPTMMLCPCRSVSAATIAPSTHRRSAGDDSCSVSVAVDTKTQPQHVVVARQAWKKKSLVGRAAAPAEKSNTTTDVESELSSAVSSTKEDATSEVRQQPDERRDEEAIEGIFRLRVRSPSTEERDDMLSLKRANPVFDSDDESDEGYYAYCNYGLGSPTKRLRSSGIVEEEEEDDDREDYERCGEDGNERDAVPIGPGQSYFLPQNLWKQSSFLSDTDTDDESTSDSSAEDDFHRREERLFWNGTIPAFASSSS